MVKLDHIDAKGEKVNLDGLTSHSEIADGSLDSDIPVVDEKALLRKIDWQMIPWLSFLYLLSFLDRSNVGNARLYNLEADLHMTDTQYLIALTTFFFPYAFVEMPSNILLKRFRPSLWLSFLMLVWGIIMILHGFVKNYGGFVTVRVLLGLFEGGLYPGVVYYLSCWYKRDELGKRVAIFFSAATVSGAFGGLLAAAISNIDGVGGKPAWAWIFIIEGLITTVAGIASFWIIQDFPSTAKFITEEERNFIVQRLRDDQQFSATGEEFKGKSIRQALSEKKTWISFGIFMGFDGPLYAFSLFTPTVINKLGFKSTAANLLSVPVYAWACFLTCIVGVVADKYKSGIRSYINLTFFSIGIIGYIILLVSRNAALSYFAVYLAASGIYPTIPNSAVWTALNYEGTYKRGAALGLLIGWANLNGAVTSNVYRSEDAPWFPLGHGIVLAYIGIGWISTLALRLVLRAENAKRERGERNEIISPDGEEKNVFRSVEDARREKGDQWSGFRYTL